MKLAILIKKIEYRKALIAKHRDVLRNIQDDLNSFLESVDYGLEDLTEAKRNLDNALDSLSEHI